MGRQGELGRMEKGWGTDSVTGPAAMCSLNCLGTIWGFRGRE